MNRKVIGFLASFVATALTAAAVNNPASTTQFESGIYTEGASDYTVRVGYQGEYVLNRYLKDKVLKNNAKATIVRQGAVLTVGYYDRFDLFIGLGKATFSDQYYDITDTEFPSERVIVDDGAFWTLGGRAIVWSEGDLMVNAFADYTNTKGKIAAIETWGGYENKISSNSDMKATEYQFGVGLSRTIEVSPSMNLIPSIAFRYSDGEFKFGRNSFDSLTNNDLKARNHLGMTIGCGLYAGKFFGLNVETQLGDSTGFTFTTDVRL